MLDQVVATEELLQQWIFEKQKAEVIFALENGEAVGFALFFHNFSTFLGQAHGRLDRLPNHRSDPDGSGKIRGTAMKIYDISQEVFSCAVYPGDPQPERQVLYSTEAGDLYNLTSFAMCAHNGTHIDAPFHFLHNGRTVDRMDLSHFVGDCYVTRHSGDVTAEDAQAILHRSGSAERILIAGNATVTAESAEVFAAGHIKLLGNEGQTVGPADAPMQVHLILLSREVALLEGIILKDVPEGRYFLSAAPLNLGGADGAPCRAYLISWEDNHDTE